MEVLHDRQADILTVIAGESPVANRPVAECDEDKPGTTLGYDASGNLVSIEILDASRRVGLPTQIEYQVVPVGV
jgi:YD repeat-containing protein